MAKTIARLFDHVTLGEAANHLASILQEPVSELDVLRLALAGRLQLAVYVPAAEEARHGEQFERRTHILGLCDLPHPLKGLARFEVERRYQWLRDHRKIHPPDDVRAACEDTLAGERVRRIKAADGIEVLHCDRSYLFEWYASRQSALPLHSYFVVTMSALDAFKPSGISLSERLDRAPKDAKERKRFDAIMKALAKKVSRQVSPLKATVPRAELLRAVFSLAEEAGYDLRKSSKTASAIETLTIENGERVARRTIEKYLAEGRRLRTPSR